MLKCSAEDLPLYRPALIGRSPEAIINRIDEKLLLKAGQKDAAVMFSAGVEKTGELKWSGTYRGTPDSKLLEQEVLRVLANAKMIPAVRDHPADRGRFYGTVLFEVVDNKPRLRIFSNQEESELKKKAILSDRSYAWAETRNFPGCIIRARSGAAGGRTGRSDLWVKIDASGNLQEERSGQGISAALGFGDAALDDFANAKFIPAFRDGKPVSCEITLPLYYKPESEPAGSRDGAGRNAGERFFPARPRQLCPRSHWVRANLEFVRRVIVETEAYNAIGDEACHCFVRPSVARSSSEIMLGRPTFISITAFTGC